jgi:hypothetical protein
MAVGKLTLLLQGNRQRLDNSWDENRGGGEMRERGAFSVFVQPYSWIAITAENIVRSSVSEPVLLLVFIIITHCLIPPPLLHTILRDSVTRL